MRLYRRSFFVVTIKCRFFFKFEQQNCSIDWGVNIINIDIVNINIGNINFNIVNIDFIVLQTSKLSLTTHLFYEKPQDLPQSDVSSFYC